ncbi:MAG: cellulase family glycosylhydrolase, partial [Candidatus Aenigmarchaeota archaeon]|nr:cellulase family glycosylhydrolase [Candidatus Aenigmarchaeota archaeon]
MKKLFLVFVLILLLFLITPVKALSPLHIEGRYIKDENNNTVVLRGVNWGEFASSCTGRFITPGEMTPAGFNVWDEATVRAHLQGMKDWGVNVIRTQGQLEWWIYNSSTTLTGQATNRPFRESYKDFLRLAEEYEFYVVLTWYSISPGGGQDVLPYPPFSHTDGGRVITSKQDFIDAWVDIATELKDYPNLIFELWNEPAPGLTAVVQDWFYTMQDCIDAIRATGADNIIIPHLGYCTDVNWVQNPEWGWDKSVNCYLNGTNLLFSGHIYRFHSSFDNNKNCPVDYEYIKSKIESPESWPDGLCYKKVLEERNVPLFVGEIGGWYRTDITCPSPCTDENESVFFANALRVLNELGISYTAWVMQQETWSGFSLQLHEPAVQGPNENGLILINALRGEYPVNITGIVTDSDTGLPI